MLRQFTTLEQLKILLSIEDINQDPELRENVDTANAEIQQALKPYNEIIEGSEQYQFVSITARHLAASLFYTREGQREMGERYEAIYKRQLKNLQASLKADVAPRTQSVLISSQDPREGRAFLPSDRGVLFHDDF